MTPARLWMLGALLGVPSLAPAQTPRAPSGRCVFNVDSDNAGRIIKLPSGQYNGFTGGNVVARCPSQGIVLKSDSLEQYGDEGRLVFIGRVDYREPRLSLKSDHLTYFQREERFVATGNVDARLPSGSTLKGPQVDFLRAVPRVRARQQVTAIGRPTIALVEKDSRGRVQPPVTVTGNTVWLEGDSVVASSGGVVVVRPELTATGDSLFADAGSGLLRIMRTPKVVGSRGRSYTLVGETIDVLTKQKKLDRVLSKRGAEAVSEDLTLKSDTIDLRVTDDLLQRAIAWGSSRARAMSTAQSIVADSIDVLLPSQRVREIRALRGASAEGDADTVKFRTTEKDRLTGDTIVARFDSLTVQDTAKARLREVTAFGQATSLQHLAPQDTSCRVPAVNYVKGRLIRISFVTGRIDNVNVTDPDASGQGISVEPRCSPAAGSRATPAGATSARPNPAGQGAPPAAPVPSPTSVPGRPGAATPVTTVPARRP